MGFFSGLKSWAGKAVGAIGGVLKKVGSFAEPILRKVADFAPAVGGVIGSGILAISAGLGQPEGIALGEGIRRGSEWLGNFGSKAADIANTAQNIGGHAQNIGNYLNGS